MSPARWSWEAVFSVSPAEKIFTSNRFSLLGQKDLPDSGHDPGPDPPPLLHQLSSVASQDNATAAVGLRSALKQKVRFCFPRRINTCPTS